jgi:DNA-binding NarL/FixJ family response regulator
MIPTKILLADDHALLRAGLRSLLTQMSDIEIVAEAGNGLEALELIGQFKPHVALLDIGMPGMNGLEVTARISKDYPDVRVIILSMHATESYVKRALVAGARGYLPKDVHPDQLRGAIEAVRNGGFFLSSSLSNQVASALMNPRSEHSGELEKLTPRQREVLQLLAEGYRTKEIARKLQIGARTVETYRSQLMNELNIHDIVGLVHFAIRHGLVEPENRSDP